MKRHKGKITFISRFTHFSHLNRTTEKARREKVYHIHYPGLTAISSSLIERSSACTVSKDIYLGLPIVTKVHTFYCITYENEHQGLR